MEIPSLSSRLFMPSNHVEFKNHNRRDCLAIESCRTHALSLWRQKPTSRELSFPDHESIPLRWARPFIVYIGTNDDKFIVTNRTESSESWQSNVWEESSSAERTSAKSWSMYLVQMRDTGSMQVRQHSMKNLMESAWISLYCIVTAETSTPRMLNLSSTFMVDTDAVFFLFHR